MSEAVAAPRSAWIVGPRFDLLFFSTGWLLPLLVVAPLGSLASGLPAGFFTIWVYHLFIRLPHFGAMFLNTYLRREQLDYFRKHWVRYFVVPVAILALYAAPLATPEAYGSSFGSVIAHVAYVWGYQHIGMQNYGILQIYRMRSGVAVDPSAARFEKAIFYTIIIAVAVHNHLLPTLSGRVGYASAATASTLDGAFFVVLAGLVAIYLVRGFRRGGFTLPALLYLAVSLAAMIQWPFYRDLPAGSWFLVFNGHHSVAYLGLLFMMGWNRREPGAPLTPGRACAEYAKFIAPLVGFALVLLIGVVVYSSARATVLDTEYAGGSLEVLLGFFVTHYYVEAMVWKFRNPHVRRTTLPLLRPPGAP